MTFASGIFLPSATHCLVSSNFTDHFLKVFLMASRVFWTRKCWDLTILTCT